MTSRTTIRFFRCYFLASVITILLGQENATTKPAVAAPSKVPSYVLGPDDGLTILAMEADEISGKSFRIDESGYISVPLAGHFRAEGLTVERFEVELKMRLQRFIRNPEVSVMVSEFHSQPVSVLGAVANPGVQQLRSSRTLLDVIALAGGLRADAGTTVKITRDRESGPIPVRNAVLDSSGNYYVSQLDLAALSTARDPGVNFVLHPHDIVTVEPADKVYAIGELAHPGEFPAKEGTMTLLQVLSMAGGLNKGAAGNKAAILRPMLDGPKRASLPVDIQKILTGQSSDLPVLPGDILFVPSAANAGKHVLAKTLEGLVQWGPYFLFAGLIR